MGGLPELSNCYCHPGQQGGFPFGLKQHDAKASPLLPERCRFLGRRDEDLEDAFDRRRPRSAQARNRGMEVADGAAGSMGIGDLLRRQR